MDNELTPADTPPRRPWTPTERPGDVKHNAPVVYLGDTQVDLDTPPNERVSAETSRSGSSRPQSTFILPSSPLDLEPAPLRPRSESFVLPHQRRDASPAPGRRDASPFRVFQAERTRSPTSPILSSSRHLASMNREGSRDLSPLRQIQSQPVLRNEQPSASENAYQQQNIDSDDEYTGQERPEDAKGSVLPSQRRNSPQIRTNEAAHTNASTTKTLSLPNVHTKNTDAVSSTLLPSVAGRTSARQISILLINPNSTASMTQSCLDSLAPSLPPDVTVHAFTAPFPSPTAIESQTDAIISTSACIKPVLAAAESNRYDAFLIACFSAHPLINALRERMHQPVIGIMEAALYASRMLGSRLGVVTTSVRSKLLHDASIKVVYGLDAFSVGTESSKLGVLDLHQKPRQEVQERMANAAAQLVQRGADCVCMGCAGMSDLKEACQDAVGMHDRYAMIIDGVGVGVQFLTGLVREGLGTAKSGIYAGQASSFPAHKI